MVPQDVPQLQLAAAAAEALPRTGGGAAFNSWLGERRQAQEGQRHLDDVSRRRPCTARSLSCATRGPSAGAWNGRRTKLRNSK